MILPPRIEKWMDPVLQSALFHLSAWCIAVLTDVQPYARLILTPEVEAEYEPKDISEEAVPVEEI